MERRRIVKSGNTSYTFAMPIEWIRKNKLEKGNLIEVSENEVGDLIISPDNKEKISFENKILTIKTDEKDMDTIYFEILNAYFRDYQTIILEGKKIAKISDKIILQMKSLIGLDVIDQTKDSIVIKNFSSEDKELFPRALIKKMNFGIIEMFDLLFNFFKLGFSKDNFFELQKVKEQNERIYFLMRKIILKGIENPALIKTFQTTYHQLSKDKIISSILNNLSYLLESIGKSFLYLEHTKKDIIFLKKSFKSVEEEYRIIISAMKYKNYSDIYKIISKYDQSISEIKLNRKGFKNPLTLETMTYILVIKNMLNRLAFEIIE